MGYTLSLGMCLVQPHINSELFTVVFLGMVYHLSGRYKKPLRVIQICIPVVQNTVGCTFYIRQMCCHVTCLIAVQSETVIGCEC